MFFSGGISLKPSLNMDAMRADMGGAACVLASIYSAARLKLPINIRGTSSGADPGLWSKGAAELDPRGP